MDYMVFSTLIIVCVLAGSARPKAAAKTLTRETRQATRFYCSGQGYQVDTSDRRRYYFCRLYAPNVYVAYRYTCPDDQIFTAASQRCAPGPVCAVNICTGGMEGDLFCDSANPAMPQLVTCVTEGECLIPSAFSCPDDQVFCKSSPDTNAGVCQAPGEDCPDNRQCAAPELVCAVNICTGGMEGDLFCDSANPAMPQLVTCATEGKCLIPSTFSCPDDQVFCKSSPDTNAGVCQAPGEDCPENRQCAAPELVCAVNICTGGMEGDLFCDSANPAMPQLVTCATEGECLIPSTFSCPDDQVFCKSSPDTNAGVCQAPGEDCPDNRQCAAPELVCAVNICTGGMEGDLFCDSANPAMPQLVTCVTEGECLIPSTFSCPDDQVFCKSSPDTNAGVCQAPGEDCPDNRQCAAPELVCAVNICTGGMEGDLFCDSANPAMPQLVTCVTEGECLIPSTFSCPDDQVFCKSSPDTNAGVCQAPGEDCPENRQCAAPELVCAVNICTGGMEGDLFCDSANPAMPQLVTCATEGECLIPSTFSCPDDQVFCKSSPDTNAGVCQAPGEDCPDNRQCAAPELVCAVNICTGGMEGDLFCDSANPAMPQLVTCATEGECLIPSTFSCPDDQVFCKSSPDTNAGVCQAPGEDCPDNRQCAAPELVCAVNICTGGMEGDLFCDSANPAMPQLVTCATEGECLIPSTFSCPDDQVFCKSSPDTNAGVCQAPGEDCPDNRQCAAPELVCAVNICTGGMEGDLFCDSANPAMPQLVTCATEGECLIPSTFSCPDDQVFCKSSPDTNAGVCQAPGEDCPENRQCAAPELVCAVNICTGGMEGDLFCDSANPAMPQLVTCATEGECLIPSTFSCPDDQVFCKSSPDTNAGVCQAPGEDCPDNRQCAAR